MHWTKLANSVSGCILPVPSQKKSLFANQLTMKHQYDHSAVVRNFNVGDRVLALLLIPGSALSAKFTVPYKILESLSESDYIVKTLTGGLKLVFVMSTC